MQPYRGQYIYFEFGKRKILPEIINFGNLIKIGLDASMFAIEMCFYGMTRAEFHAPI